MRTLWEVCKFVGGRRSAVLCVFGGLRTCHTARGNEIKGIDIQAYRSARQTTNHNRPTLYPK